MEFLQTWSIPERHQPGEGRWSDEPEKAYWIDEATGLDCLIVRGPSGALCGYAGVPPGHPWHGIDYQGCVEASCDNEERWNCPHRPDGQIEVHGGLTFADKCAEGGGLICHEPQPGRPADVWWFGFDCAHSGDLCPAYRREHALYESYRGIEYVASEVRRLAAQLAAIASPTTAPGGAE